MHTISSATRLDSIFREHALRSGTELLRELQPLHPAGSALISCMQGGISGLKTQDTLMCERRSMAISRISGLMQLTENVCLTSFIPENRDRQEASSVLEPQRPGGLME